MSSREPFVYILNRFERAAQSERPANEEYAYKRRDVLDYVAVHNEEIARLKAVNEAQAEVIRKQAERTRSLAAKVAEARRLANLHLEYTACYDLAGDILAALSDEANDE